jgi:N-acetylmuramoyl-L-alanine amidase
VARTLAVAVTLALAAVALPGAPPAGPRAPLVVVDPGHDRYPNSQTEPIGPGSTVRKIKDGGGTRGARTGVPEHAVTLAVSRQLAAMLRRAGVRVVLTRTRSASVSMGNVERAQIANRGRAALFLRIHADGSASRSLRGTHTLVPAFRRGWTDDIHAASRRAGRLVQAELVRALRLPNRGIQERTDITGFNWADVPAVLPELGYLTNSVDERLLTGASGQRRAALGLCRGTLRFLDLPPERCR